MFSGLSVDLRQEGLSEGKPCARRLDAVSPPTHPALPFAAAFRGPLLVIFRVMQVVLNQAPLLLRQSTEAISEALDNAERLIPGLRCVLCLPVCVCG